MTAKKARYHNKDKSKRKPLTDAQLMMLERKNRLQVNIITNRCGGGFRTSFKKICDDH